MTSPRFHRRRFSRPHPQARLDNVYIGPGGQVSLASSSSDDDVPKEQPQIMPGQQQAPMSVVGSSSDVERSASFTSPSPSPLVPIAISATSASPSEPAFASERSGQISESSPVVASTITVTSSNSAILSSTLSSDSMTSASTSISESATVSSTESMVTSTPAPSDSPSDSSSLPPSSPTSAIAIAVSESASSSSTASPSDALSTHSPPFYIGIALGVIALVACITALLAWWVRLRRHQKRLSSSPVVPWAKSHNEDHDDGLEKGDHAGGATAEQPWEPRGDRDVGEPRRTPSFINRPFASSPRTIPTHPEHAMYPHGGITYPLPLHRDPYFSPHALSSHSPNPAGSNTLGPLQVANLMPGDRSQPGSRAPTALGMSTAVEPDAMDRPRFLGLEGDGLNVPWRQAELPSTLTFEHHGDNVGGKEEHIPRLPFPGETNESEREQQQADRDGWTASLRSNIVNAFNAVASSLPNAATYGYEDQDKLTPLPTKARRTSVLRADRNQPQDKNWVVYVGGELVGKPLTREATTSSAVSKAWTLEETRDGSGVVHIKGMGLEDYGGGDHAFSPQVSTSTVNQPNTSVPSFLSFGSTAPLLPKRAFLQPSEGSLSSRASSAYSVSRASSVYSTATLSSTFEVPEIPPVSRTSTMSLGSVYGSEPSSSRASSRKGTMRRKVRRNASVASYASALTEREEVARVALKERRMRMKARRSKIEEAQA